MHTVITTGCLSLFFHIAPDIRVPYRLSIIDIDWLFGNYVYACACVCVSVNGDGVTLVLVGA